MKRKAALLLAATAVVLAVLLATTVTRANNAGITTAGVDWDLTHMTLAGSGQVIDMDEGTFVRGMVVEAQAVARGGPLLPRGTFRLTFDVFCPNRDMPPQRAGNYYVVGDWTITQEGASVEAAAARHSAAVINGRLQAELPFNPAGAQSWTATAALPMSPAAGRWGRGQGSFSFEAGGSGRLSLDVALWPVVQPAQ